jgi:hypothetical protein
MSVWLRVIDELMSDLRATPLSTLYRTAYAMAMTMAVDSARVKLANRQVG